MQVPDFLTLPVVAMPGVYIGDRPSAAKKERKPIEAKQTNPECYNKDCKTSHVIMVGKHSDGADGTLRVWMCDESRGGCGERWQEVPPDLVLPGSVREVFRCKKRHIRAGQYMCKRPGCGKPKKVDGVSHICNNPKPKSSIAKRRTTWQQISLPLPNVTPPSAQPISQTAIRPASLSVEANVHLGASTDDVIDAHIFAEDITAILLSENAGADAVHTCSVCNESGTFFAGQSESLLNCNKCEKVCIHFTCLDQFTAVWECPACSE